MQKRGSTVFRKSSHHTEYLSILFTSNASNLKQEKRMKRKWTEEEAQVQQVSEMAERRVLKARRMANMFEQNNMPDQAKKENALVETYLARIDKSYCIQSDEVKKLKRKMAQDAASSTAGAPAASPAAGAPAASPAAGAPTTSPVAPVAGAPTAPSAADASSTAGLKLAPTEGAATVPPAAGAPLVPVKIEPPEDTSSKKLPKKPSRKAKLQAQCDEAKISYKDKDTIECLTEKLAKKNNEQQSTDEKKQSPSEQPQSASTLADCGSRKPGSGT